MAAPLAEVRARVFVSAALRRDARLLPPVGAPLAL